MDDVDLEYARRARRNKGNNLCVFGLQNRSLSAREPLALAASNGRFGMRQLAGVLGDASDERSRGHAVRTIGSFHLKTTLALARLLAGQNLLPEDRPTATAILSLAIEVFPVAQVPVGDRILLLELLAEAGRTVEFESALGRVKLPDAFRHQARLLAANLTIPWTRRFDDPDVARRRWHSIVAEVFSAGAAEPIAVLAESRSPADSIVCAAESSVTEGPLVTVLVPTRSGGHRLSTAMAGLVAQTWRNLEIILIDDASDPVHRPYLDVWAERDDRVRVIRAREPVGEFGAINLGARLAQAS